MMNDNMHNEIAVMPHDIPMVLPQADLAAGAILRPVADSGRSYTGNHESRVIRIRTDKTPPV